MTLNDYLEIKKALLQELKETLLEQRKIAIFEEINSINRVIEEKYGDEKTRACT